MSYNQFNNNRSYKHIHGSFKKNTNDYHVGKNGLEPWDRESFSEYCIHNLEYIVRNNDYSHVVPIRKKFLNLFECICQSEFEDKVLNPILRKLCKLYELEWEEVHKRLYENKCVSYEENFN